MKGKTVNSVKTKASSSTTITSAFLLWLLITFQFLLFFLPATKAKDEVSGPVFEREPPDHVDFSSLSGTVVHCSARGNPRPSIKWLQADSNTVPPNDRFRRVASNGSLTFLPFQSEDYRPDVHATVYRCVASNSIGTIVSREVHIKAVVPHPPDIQVYNVHSIVGSTAVIRCHVSAILSDYVHVTSWIRDGKLWIDSTTTEASGKYMITADGDLHILNLQMSETGSSYQCKAANRLTNEVYLSTTAGKVFVTAPQGNVPPEISHSKPAMTVRQGETTIIPCATQGHPLPSTTWYGKVGGGQLHPLLIGERLQQLGSGLLIKDVQVSDSGTYVCDASNDVGTKRDETMLTVTVPLHAVIEPALLFAELGKPATFNCNITGTPVMSVGWLNNGKWLPLNDGNIGPTQVLKISEVKLPDRGMYQCIVNNNFQSAQATAELRLQDAAPRIMEYFEEKVLPAGQSLALKCVAFGIPQPQMFWHLDFNNIRKSNNTHTEERTDSNGNVVSVLHFRNLNVRDAGLYQCSANNQAGKAVHAARINVHGPPFGRQVPKQSFVSGSTVYLNCPIYGHPIQIYQWEKDGRLLPNNLRQAVYQNATLVIEKVKRPNDVGRYTCSAWNKNGQRASATIHVDISVPPRITPFSFQDQLIREGMRARLQCVISDGDLPLKISWTKDGHPVASDLGVTIRDLDEYSSILTINKITPRNNGNYTCVASNPAGSAFYTAILFVNAIPKITPFSFQGDPLLEGAFAHLSCVVYQGVLPITFEWLKDDLPISEDLKIKIRDIDDYSSILTIDKVSRRHSGKYTCVVHNEAATTRHSAQLVVNVPPKWITEPSDTSVAMNFDIILHCQAEGSPTPVITWMKQEGPQPGHRREIITSNYHYNLFSNGSLLIKNAEDSDEGVYFCQASNGVDEGLSTAMQLYVNVPPHATAINKTVSAKIRTNLTLSCEVKGDEPLDVTWLRSGIPLQVTKTSRYRTHLIPSTKSKITELFIKSVHRDDSSTFACVAKNTFGEHTANISVDIQEPPDPVKKIKMGKPASRSMELSWNPPFNGNLPILGYIVEFWPKDMASGKLLEPTNTSISADTASITISYLKPATSYHVRIFSFNKLGHSNSSEVMDFMTAEEAPSAPPQEVQVTAVDAHTVKVTWKPPNPEFHNGKLRGYKVGYKVHGMNEPFQYKPIDISNGTQELSLNIGKLEQFTIYEFVVEAYSGPGRGPPSEPILVATAEDVPSAPPQDVRCTPPTAKSIHMTWQPPPTMSINGILRGYRILYKPVDEWYESSPLKNLTVKPTTYTVEGLRVFTNYSLQVLAFTKAGDGVISKPIFCRTLGDFPESPAAIKAAPTGNNSIIVAWKRPLQANGILIHYDVFVREVDNSMKDLRKYTIPASENQLEISGLRSGFRYEFWVTASTSVGEGKATKSLIESPDGPLVPAKIVAFNETVVAIWKSNITLPCRAVGIPTPNQRWFKRGISIKSSDHTDRIQIHQEGALTIHGLKGEDAGNYTCLVNNEFSKDMIVYDLYVLEPPYPPEVINVTTTLTSIKIRWTPGKNGGLKIEGYILYYKSETTKLQKINISTEAYTHELQNLNCGRKYKIWMTAFNKLGFGPKSQELEISTDGDVPGAPDKENFIKVGKSSASVQLSSWKSNGCPIHRYIIEYLPKSASKVEAAIREVAPEKTFLLSDLKPATWYRLRMTAENSAGTFATEYEFATLTATGGTIAPDIAADEGFMEPTGLLSDLDQWLIVAAASSIAGLLCLLVVICLFVKRKKRQQRRKPQSGEPKRMANKSESAVGIGFRYLRGNPEKLRFGKGYFCGGKKEKKPDLMPYSTTNLSNQEMTLFNNHLASPTDNESLESSVKLNGQTPQRFARPKPYQSGFRTPTHDPYSRGMRIPHPVPIPTAPPMSDNSSQVYRVPPANFEAVQINNGKHTTPIKSSSKYLLRDSKGDVKTSETTFVFPPPFEEVCSSTSGQDVTENNYENVSSGPPPCPTNIPPRPKLTLGLTKLQ